MTNSKQCVLALVLGLALAGKSYGEETGFVERFDSSASLVRLAASSDWNADQPAEPSPFAEEPIAKPEPATEAASNAESDLSCGPEDECCYAPEYSLIAGVEATFFWPQLTRNFLTTSVDSGSGAVDFRSNASLGSVDGGLLVAPRITLGVQGCKWGLVGRYWYASPWASGYTPADPSLAPAGVILFDNFRAYTVDLELQRRFYAGSWSGYGLFGVRYASIDNDRSLAAASLDDVIAVHSSSFASQQFNGTGVTFGLWATRPIWCDSPLKYFVANRYSFLWGNADVAAQTTASVMNDADGFATSTDGALASGQGDLFIWELQVGLQWDAQLKCFPGRAFVRSAVEYQYWDANTGLQAAADSSASVAGGGSAEAASSARDLLFSLIGVNIGAGITY